MRRLGGVCTCEINVLSNLKQVCQVLFMFFSCSPINVQARGRDFAIEPPVDLGEDFPLSIDLQ